MNQQIEFGASVAGGVPVISGLHEGLAGDELFKIRGILNGTCNYILSQIESNGIPFATALREAQKLGFAEADPTEDIDGLDARAKLAILARVGLHCDVKPESIVARSISAIDSVDFEYANQLGCTIRQISWAELKGRAKTECARVTNCLRRSSRRWSNSHRRWRAWKAAKTWWWRPEPMAARRSLEATAQADIQPPSRSSPTFSPSLAPSKPG